VAINDALPLEASGCTKFEKWYIPQWTYCCGGAVGNCEIAWLYIMGRAPFPSNLFLRAAFPCVAFLRSAILPRHFCAILFCTARYHTIVLPPVGYHSLAVRFWESCITICKTKYEKTTMRYSSFLKHHSSRKQHIYILQAYNVNVDAESASPVEAVQVTLMVHDLFSSLSEPFSYKLCITEFIMSW